MILTDTSRKAINFDLDTKILASTFGKNYHNKYKKIENDLDKLGFIHRQGSGYVSEKPLNERDTIKVIKKLTKQNPWLATCTKQFDITNVGQQYSVLNVIKTTSQSLVKAPPSKDNERER